MKLQEIDSRNVVLNNVKINTFYQINFFCNYKNVLLTEQTNPEENGLYSIKKFKYNGDFPPDINNIINSYFDLYYFESIPRDDNLCFRVITITPSIIITKYYLDWCIDGYIRYTPDKFIDMLILALTKLYFCCRNHNNSNCRL